MRRWCRLLAALYGLVKHWSSSMPRRRKLTAEEKQKIREDIAAKERELHRQGHSG
jgi:Spy/CpxP family protein refolding chaperone